MHCVRQMLITPVNDWFSESPINKTVRFRVAFIVVGLRHTCLISILMWYTCAVEGIIKAITHYHYLLIIFERNGCFLFVENVLDL